MEADIEKVKNTSENKQNISFFGIFSISEITPSSKYLFSNFYNENKKHY